MKTSIAVLVLLSMTGFAKDLKPIKPSYDKMQNITTISGWMEDAKQPKNAADHKWGSYGLRAMEVGAMYACQGETAHCTPKHVLLIFHAWTNQWLFLNNSQVFFLIDGKRVGPVVSTSTAKNVSASACSVDSGLCALEETVTVLAIPDHFKTLANSKDVEVQINGFNIELTDKNFAALKQVADSLD